MYINRVTILESTYEVIKDSLEWADSYQGKYFDYIDGVLSMSEWLLGKLDKTINVDEEK